MHSAVALTAVRYVSLRTFSSQVMTAWKTSQGLAGSDMIEFLADTHAELTEALDLTLTGDGKAYGQGEGPNKALDGSK